MAPPAKGICSNNRTPSEQQPKTLTIVCKNIVYFFRFLILNYIAYYRVRGTRTQPLISVGCFMLFCPVQFIRKVFSD